MTNEIENIIYSGHIRKAAEEELKNSKYVSDQSHSLFKTQEITDSITMK